MLGALIVGYLAIFALVAHSSKRAGELIRVLAKRVGPLTIGMRAEDIQYGNPAPDLICPQNRVRRLWNGNEGYEIWTARTWVYRVRESEISACWPDYEDTEIGFDNAGTVIWFTRCSGESYTEVGGSD
jgi:hypothetical protein